MSNYLSVCSVVYKFPDSAKFNRIISKNKIYENAFPTYKVKNLFVSEVERIIWAYKLSPATINISAGQYVQEIQVLNIILKTGELSFEVLQTIDKAIPSPILFILNYNKKYRYTAAYKRPSETDKDKWVIIGYFQSEWMDYDTEMIELPIVLNMDALYEAFLTKLMPIQKRIGESLQQLIDRVERVQKIEREVDKLEKRIKKEKQFNRRVELNRRLNELKAEIRSLKDG